MSMQISSRFAISIHASAKEATLVSQTSQQFALISIHASAKEATRGGWLHNLQCRFQSTPPRRRRRQTSRNRLRLYCTFQSTPPRRRRQRVPPQQRRQKKFQSTPPRRRRQSAHPPINRLGQFQSTPPRRRRRNEVVEDMTYYISIHASAKEATATYCDTSAIMYISSLNNFFVHFFQLYIAICCTILSFLSANTLRFLRSL